MHPQKNSDNSPKGYTGEKHAYLLTLNQNMVPRRGVLEIFRGRFGLFVSALKIPFPRNGDFGSKRPVRMRCR